MCRPLTLGRLRGCRARSNQTAPIYWHSTQATGLSTALRLDIPNYMAQPRGESARHGSEGTLLLVSFVCSTLGSLAHPASKLRALDVLLTFGFHLSDAYKLDRILPYMCSLLTDSQAAVRAGAVRAVTQLLAMADKVRRGARARIGTHARNRGLTSRPVHTARARPPPLGWGGYRHHPTWVTSSRATWFRC